MNRMEFTPMNKTSKTTDYMEIKNKENFQELYISGSICIDEKSKQRDEDVSATDVRTFLSQLDKDKDLNIYINSGGGSVYSGLSIYNQLDRLGCKKTVYIDGIAGSIASVIALVGDKVYMPANSQMMIHKPMLFLYGSFNTNDFAELSKGLDACEKSIVEVYKANANKGVSEEKIKDMLKKETYLNAAQCAEIFSNVFLEESKSSTENSLSELEKIKNRIRFM